MKKQLFIWPILIFLISAKAYAQPDKYKLFRDYLLGHCKIPKSVTNDCGWQLAMVKLTTNKEGRVSAYSLLNQTSDSLKLSFKPLIGYQFPARLNMRNKTFVFAYTSYNLKSGCNTGWGTSDPQKVFETTYQCIAKEFQTNPKTIFYDLTIGSQEIDESTRDLRP